MPFENFCPSISYLSLVSFLRYFPAIGPFPPVYNVRYNTYNSWLPEQFSGSQAAS
jgi:hypothetical protein